MGTTFSAPVYSDGIDRARRDPAQARQAFGLLDTMRRDLPGYGTDDRYQQSQHFKGVVFLAISARMDTMAGASVAVLRRRRRDRKKTTFGPGGSVAKALATPHAESRDEEYAPFEDDGHTLVRRMREPNDNEDIGDLLAYGTLQYDLTGTMPLWAVPNSAGRPVEFHALPTALTLPNPGRSPQYPNGSWRVQPFYPGGGMSYLPGFGPAGAVLPGEEVKRLKAPHPLLRWDGYSPLTAGSVQLDVLEAIDQSRWAAFDHGIQFDTVMIAPGMDEGAAQRLSSQMVEKAGGARNARKFVVFAPPAGMGPGDKTDIKTLNQSNREMDFHQSWEQAVAFGLALFGTPRGVVGLDTAGSYSQLYAELRQYHHRQSSYARKVSKFLTRVAARPWCSFPGEYVVQVDIPKPDDPDLLETQLKADQDILTVNQRHALRNRPPVEGGDVPASIYLDTLKAKLNPAPQPGPGIPPEAGGAPKPLPGATPTGGAPPGEDLPEAEDTRPPAANRVAKAFDESKVKRDHGKFAAKEAHAERSKARESRRNAAGDARAHHDLSAPPVESGWHEGLSDEQHAAALKQHWDDHATHTRTVRRKLEAAGASEKELAEFDRRAEKARGALEKHHPRLAKLRAKAIAARKAADDHDALREAIEAEEPEEPTPEDEPEEPDRPEPPVSEFPDLSPGGEPKREDYDSDGEHEDAVAQWESDVNDYDEFEKDYDEWEGERRDRREERAAVAARNEKAEAAHAKARAAWEKKLDRHDEKAEKLTEKADDAESDHGAADDEYREEYEDGLVRVGEHVSDVEDRIIADADAEDEADPEPDDEDEDEPVGKAMSALTLSGGGALVPGGGAAVAGKRTKKRKCRPGLGRFLKRELKALGGG